MFDLTLLSRHQYFPSGKFDVSRFVAGSFLLVFVGCLSGIIAGLLYRAIAIVPILSYATVLVPIAVGFPLAWCVAKFVYFAHCRNPRLAAIAGAVCGVVTFLSACQIDGVAATLRGGEKTTLLSAVAQTDQVQRTIFGRVFGPKIPLPKRNLYSRFNFTQFLMLMSEVAIFICIPMNSGRNFARRAYGESIDRWLERSVIRTSPGSGDKIVSALEAGEYLVQTLSSLPNSPTGEQKTESKYTPLFSFQSAGSIAATWMLLEVSSFPAANGAYEAYLSAAEIDTRGRKRPLFQQLKLRTHEIPTARKLFLELSTDLSSDEAINLSDHDLKVETTGLYVQFAARKIRRSASRVS